MAPAPISLFHVRVLSTSCPWRLPMHCSSVVHVVVLAMLASTAVAQRKTTPPRSVMPWMCLEICNTPDEIQHQLDTIRSHKSLLTAVSFEKYSLGAGCNLSGVDVQNLSEVNADIQMAGLEAWPMITSWPHPADFLQRMREVFASEECAQRFISAALDEAKAHNYTGFNLDWEPTAPPNTTLPVTAADATAYASFVDVFAKALHKEGVQLSVDVATWVTVPGGPSIWNYDALAATTVDRAVSMGTYTSSDSSFTHQLQLLTSAFSVEKATVGLQTVNATDGSPISDAQVAFRFQSLEAAGVDSIALWDMPIPDHWWPHIEAFVNK